MMLENRLPELESRLVENIFNTTPEEHLEENSSKLNHFLEAVHVASKSSSHSNESTSPEHFHSLGEYIKDVTRKEGRKPQDIFLSIGFSSETAIEILDNRKPVVSFPANEIASLCFHIGLGLQSSKTLLVKSISTYYFAPLVQGGMARYSPTGELEQKELSMKRGMEELLLKASEARPFHSVKFPIAANALESYLQEFEKSFVALDSNADR